MASPTAENTASHDLQAQVGSVGVSATPDLSSKQPGQELDSSDRHPVSHQFTNSIPETLASSEVQVVGDATNSPPIPPTAPTAQELAAKILQCTTWVQVVEAVEQNKKKLISAAGQLTQQQRQNVSHLLAQHLCSHKDDLEQLVWLPIQLINKALQKLSFTISRIADGSINDAHIEQISGCDFDRVDRLGERGERWIFTTPYGERFTVFGTRAILAISLTAADSNL